MSYVLREGLPYQRDQIVCLFGRQKKLLELLAKVLSILRRENDIAI